MKKTYIKPETKVYTLLTEPLLNTGSISNGSNMHYKGLEEEEDNSDGSPGEGGYIWGD